MADSTDVTPEEQEGDQEVHVEPSTQEEAQDTPIRFTIQYEKDGETITEELTEDEVKQRALGCLDTESISIGCDENRQKRQYEGNKYWMSTTIRTARLPGLIHSVVGDVETKKRVSGIILGQLTGKIRGVFALQKKCIHEQEKLDAIPNIDYRRGERPEG